MPNLTTQPNPNNPSTHYGSLVENLRERGFPIAGLPAAPDPDVAEPDEPQQAELPTGPSHVVARGTSRTKDQLTSARTFLAAAGRVKFDRGRATLRSVWLAVAYRASLGDDRECFASLTTLSKQALVSVRTVRYHLVTLAALGLIHTDNRTGGHAPTKWSISEVSPSVLGGKDCRGGRQRLPGGAAKVAAEVSNRSYAPTGHELLASKQQPDGACAPPAAATKNIAATTKNTQPQTEGPEPTRTPEPTQTLAPAKTDTGGVTRGGASDKQIAYLHVLADKVGAEPAEDLWRAADPKRLQAQIKAAKIVRKRLEQGGEKHTHESNDEIILRVGIVNTIPGKEGVQRCECGAARCAWVQLDGKVDEFQPWTLCGYLVDYLEECTDLVGPQTDQELAEAEPDGLLEALTRWAVPISFSEDVRALCETAPKKSPEEAAEHATSGMPWVAGDCWVQVPADWRAAPRGRV